MSELKTQPTQDSVEDFLAALPDPQLQADSQQIKQIMAELSGKRLCSGAKWWDLACIITAMQVVTQAMPSGWVLPPKSKDWTNTKRASPASICAAFQMSIWKS